jgi:hypothetical protein
MNDMILDTNNYCSPMYTVDQCSPHYEEVWKLFGHLGWSKEQKRANFIQGRFNAFSSILHKLNQKSAYVFSTDLSKNEPHRKRMACLIRMLNAENQ